MPEAVGVPESTPVEEFSDNPSGNGNELSARANVIVAVPDAVSVCEYAVPAVGAAGVPEVNNGTPAATTVNDTFAVRDPTALVATIDRVPSAAVAVGVPEITPALDNDNPAGSVTPLPNAQVIGVVPAVTKVERSRLYASPTRANTCGIPPAYAIAVPDTPTTTETADDAEPAELVAVTVNDVVPVAEGVPESTPVVELSDKPAGREPVVTDHVIGTVPLAVNVNEYAVDWLAAVGAPDVIVGAVGPDAATTREMACAAEPPPLVAVTVKLVVPVPVGVPDRMP